jgi:hypothetical protein
MNRLIAVLVACLIAGLALASLGEDVAQERSHFDLVLEDGPAAYWRFTDEDGTATFSRIADEKTLPATLEGAAALGKAGPRGKEYPRFDDDNLALTLGEGKAFARVADPGEKSILDFGNGDSITIEAWVNPDAVADDQQVYIVGKGRTNNKGLPRDNQNYALRLRGMGGTARVSFLFRKAAREKAPEAFHRWNSEVGFLPDGTWHHVAIVYTFGKPEDVRAYVDGQESGGSWDMGGPTSEPPVVDNDELWIGSASGGNLGNTFRGRIDEIAIYRKAVDAKRLVDRYQAIKPDPRDAEFAAADESGARADEVLAELYESHVNWSLRLGEPTSRYSQPSFAFVGFPKKYTATGVIGDRSNPLLLRARMRRVVSAEQAGKYEFLLRAKNAARLYIDGQLVVQTNPTSRNASGHEEVPELAETKRPELRWLPPGCQEQFAAIELSEGEHIIRLDAIAGGKGLRAELDELCVAVARPTKPFTLLTPVASSPIPLTDAGWRRHRDELHQLLFALNKQNRLDSARDWKGYWDRRHELARDAIEQKPAPQVPELAASMPANNEIDHFIAARLAEHDAAPATLTDDYAFLRRVTLDTVGVVPSRDEIEAFVADANPTRRSRAIERLLDDPRWADHWVSYWQDVLAENPGILKPKLNNTGPFRWWIYESFLDNKPMDRFVTELVMMEGSKYQGGPAGFAMATQNDVPLAAKAHVLAKAFLAMDMTCARCHDAPYHPFKQRELFSLAAMLERKPITLPQTSTVPISEGGRKPTIEITLKPGEEIKPTWPFASLSPHKFSAEILRKEGDQREQLAAALTSSHDVRFAKVVVNRLWRRYLGRGLIEPVDDWESVDGQASHPELLDYLARQFVLSGYDLKHVARLILNSHTYQRKVQATSEQPELFAAPLRRRMSAEQLVDSLFSASGKEFNAESLTLDPEGRRPVDTFLNLGRPNRAWQFTSLSNERDRPALALPMAQSIIDLLVAYGWRDSRPNPLTVRDETPTVLQPLALANGIVGARAVRLSADSSITEICLAAETPYELIEGVCLQILSRPATESEKAMFVAAIADGFEDRRVEVKDDQRPKKRRRNTVSWSNHLSAEATRIKLEMEREVQAGDPPTPRLQADWRERMEDVVWTLFNSPEFVFVP